MSVSWRKCCLTEPQNKLRAAETLHNNKQVPNIEICTGGGLGAEIGMTVMLQVYTYIKKIHTPTAKHTTMVGIPTLITECHI
jgi:hypothetical protein